MKRHKHSLSHYRLASMEMGGLYPVACTEVMMGDVWRASSSALVRVTPLIAPVMHPVQVKLHHWFIPSRLLWAGWEDFITGGPDGIGGSAGVYPTITAGGGGFALKSLADYLGIPHGVANLNVSALPFRAYNLVYNEFYRDQDLVAKAGFTDASGADATTGQAIRQAAWEKDYLTDARPWTQKGPAVSLPLGTSAPVLGIGKVDQTWQSGASVVYESDSTTTDYGAGANKWRNISVGTAGETFRIEGKSDNYPNIRADLANATAATVSKLREAMALQRYEEARAQWGSRYVEYLRYYGIRSSDARLQRPEYLGGGKQTISFSEVLQTSDNGATAGVGDMYGHGIAAVRTRPFVRYFEEHGYVMTMFVCRPVAMYQDGLHRMWSRRIKEDYYTKELELIGQQAIARREVYAEAGAGGDTVFGYQNRYREYCEQPSGVSSEMRTILDFWHMARQFGAAPALNQSFIECVPEKRNFQVSTNDVLWCMFNHNIRARRMVSRNPVARIL